MAAMSNMFGELHRIILLENAGDKCAATKRLFADLDQYSIVHDTPVKTIDQPGYPAALQLVAPRELKRRSIQSQAGRNTLMHAIAHIEFNALNLALDAAYRFRKQPADFYLDWIKVAADEARHFGMIREYLKTHDCEYGDYKAHNGLWEMAVKTQHDIVARMALVPRVLEARGLDVTPGMIKRLSAVNDSAAVQILEVIYQDEIKHVEIGSRWFFEQCSIRELEPRSTFLAMIKTHMHGELRGPFNISARLQAGFDEMEIAALEAIARN
jgi:uncharacterized ferritin-like protein (DUF455 family)